MNLGLLTELSGVGMSPPLLSRGHVGSISETIQRTLQNDRVLYPEMDLTSWLRKASGG